MPKFLHPMLKCTSWCIKTPFHGAQTTLYCCLDDKIEHESGNYYSDCAQKPASPQGQDAEAAKSFDTYKICVYHLLDWRNLPCCLLKALSDCVFHVQFLT